MSFGGEYYIQHKGLVCNPNNAKDKGSFFKCGDCGFVFTPNKLNNYQFNWPQDSQFHYQEYNKYTHYFIPEEIIRRQEGLIKEKKLVNNQDYSDWKVEVETRIVKHALPFNQVHYLTPVKNETIDLYLNFDSKNLEYFISLSDPTPILNYANEHGVEIYQAKVSIYLLILEQVGLVFENVKELFLNKGTFTRVGKGLARKQKIPITYVSLTKNKYSQPFPKKQTTRGPIDHRFDVAGHWRKVRGLGKNRQGEYLEVGRTWVKETIKGSGEYIKKIRLVTGGDRDHKTQTNN